MTVGMLEGLTGAIGTELTLLGGYRITRLSSPFLADIRSAQGVTSATSVDAGITVDLGGGQTFAGALAGMVLRLTSGTLAGAEAVISNLPLSTQAVLVAPGLGANFASESWEVLSREESMQVETTLGWDSAGRVFVEGAEYRYATKTPTTLDGVEHFDGVSWLPGAKQDHPVIAEVLDFSQTFSAIDKLRRSLFVETALPADLNVIGTNLGVPRPPLLSNAETYRALIQAIAYSRRGTIYAMELALDAIFGAGAYEIFEDMTLGSLRNGATVFLRRNDGNELVSAGKAILEGIDRQPMASGTTVVAAETPVRVRSVLLAPDGAPFVVATGTLNASCTNVDPVTITGVFPSRIRKGDYFEITSGPQAGKRATVKSYNHGAQQITVGSVVGSPNYAVGAAFENSSWRICRESTNCRWYRPADDSRLRYPTDPSGAAAWVYIGTATEASHTTLIEDYTALGAYLQASGTAGQTVAYRRKATIAPESSARFAINFNVEQAYALAPSGDNSLQFAWSIADGERVLIVGGTWDGASPTRDIRFVGATGTSLATVAVPIDSGTPATSWHTLELVKFGRETVRLLLDGRLVLTAAYSAFSTSSAHELVWGAQSTSSFGAFRVRSVEWSHSTIKDYWNYQGAATGSTASPNRLLATGAFVVADASLLRRVRIQRADDGTVPLTPTGVAAGDWQVLAYVSADEVTVIGPTRPRAAFTRGASTRVTIQGDPEAFTYPDVIGHKLEILDGLNVGGPFAIARVLDPATGRDFARLYDANGVDVGARHRTVREKSNVVELTGAAFTFTDAEATWRIVPQFGSEASLSFEVADRGSVAGATLTIPQTLPVPFADAPCVDLVYTKLESAYALDASAANAESPPGSFSQYPFYLSDEFVWVRAVISALTVAGVFPDFDSMRRDASGAHVLS